MTWTHKEWQVLPSGLAEEALSQGMPAPHHPNCDNALPERHTSIGGGGPSTSGMTPPPSFLFMPPTFDPAPFALIPLLSRSSPSWLKRTSCEPWVAANSEHLSTVKELQDPHPVVTAEHSEQVCLIMPHMNARHETARNILPCIQGLEPPCS
jgi:hypothetical protein